ncbi:hypothetical protein [Streptomyces buecherae]|uniref:Uncharacterized protein n=1 Tax=Streptomyces buecherae TaxID=2763006 RepID=A0A7H8NKV0_9ACTN|nr:hypothetical protein [Streptomyces buecherae]QKW55043.1 hypothetical protein HUT08_36550 [Streptomyces buecherae]
MNLFDTHGANATFGALAFGVLATVLVVAGFKYRWLRSKKTLVIVFVSTLLVTVNSAGLLGEIAGAAREIMNAGGEKVVTDATGTKVAPNPPRHKVEPVSAGGALLGLCGWAWYGMKLYATKGRVRELPEIIMGAGSAVCYGTSLGFMGAVVGATVVTGNNIGLNIFGG